MTIGQRIRAIRKKKGLTQKELADKCHMADSAIRKYEADVVAPKLDKLQLMGSALGVPITDFLDLPQIEREAYRIGYCFLQYLIKKKELSEQTHTSLMLSKSEIIDWATAFLMNILNDPDEDAVNNSPVDQELQSDKDRMLALFLQLNATGRNKAMDAVEQLCMVPGYQSHSSGVYIELTPEEQTKLNQACESLKKNRLELDLMSKSNYPANASALDSSNSMITHALDVIKQILADAFDRSQSNEIK